MSEPANKPATTTATALDAQQLALPAISTPMERIEREETEVQEILNRTTQESLQRLPNVSVAEVKRVLEARAELISTIRSIAIKQTAPEDWTLYKARDGSVLGVPTAAAALKIRRWAGVSVMNHRGMTGEQSPSVRQGKNQKGEDIVVIEGFADGICGRDIMPGIYFSVRSDDQFIGRAGADTPRKGGPRQEDLMSCWRTGIDSKVVRCMTGTTKVSEAELKAHGVDTSRCVKGSGFGTSGQRDAARVADANAAGGAQALWDEIVKRTSGSEVPATELLKDCTKGKNFAGYTDHKRMTQDWQIEKAWEALRAHEVFGDNAQGR